MSKEIRKNTEPDCPESYDLFSGTPNIERIFSKSCHYLNRRDLPLFTLRISEVYRRGTYTLKHVRYPHFALEMILEGEMEFRTEDQRQIAGPGTLYLIPPGTTVHFTCRDGMEVRKLCAIFGGENLKGILVTLKLSDSRMVSLPDPDVMAGMLRDLRDTVSAPVFENSLRSYQFLLELSRLAGEENSAQLPLGRAVSLLESNFQENLQIPEIAARAGVSERTLRRLFRNELHCSPLEYLNQVRLKFATGKLQNTGLRIKEIAQRCGFVSSARFCTVFQEKYHMTPGDFRKKTKSE